MAASRTLSTVSSTLKISFPSNSKSSTMMMSMHCMSLAEEFVLRLNDCVVEMKSNPSDVVTEKKNYTISHLQLSRVTILTWYCGQVKVDGGLGF